MASGMVWFHNVSRKMPLTMSAAPASTRQASATGRSGARPNAAIAVPQAAAASAMPRPCRRTRVAQPLSAEAANAPADIAENIRPADHGACRVTAMNGISEPG